MGTFAGHALPGSFFIFFGLWAIYHMLKRFYQRRAYELQVRSEPAPCYTNRVSFPMSGCPSACCRDREIPLDSFAKAITCMIGITGEIFTGFNANWKFVHIGNLQHTTMFATFGLSGIVELLVFYGAMKTSVHVEYMFALVALLAEAYLFGFHLHGRTPVDVYIHLLLLGMVFVSIGFGLWEVMQSSQPVYALVRTWGFLMQGTWFWQVGAILYPVASWMPHWDELAKESFPRAANLFCYHMLVNFLAIVVIASVMSLRLGRFTAQRASKGVNMCHTVHHAELQEFEMKDETLLYVAPNGETVVEH